MSCILGYTHNSRLASKLVLRLTPGALGLPRARLTPRLTPGLPLGSSLAHPRLIPGSLLGSPLGPSLGTSLDSPLGLVEKRPHSSKRVHQGG